MQLLDCHQLWSEINVGIENPTEPISSALLDRLVMMTSEVFGPMEPPEAVYKWQQKMSILRHEP